MSPEPLAATAQKASCAILSLKINFLPQSNGLKVPMFVPLSTSALLVWAAHFPEAQDVKNCVYNLCPKKMAEQLMDWRNNSMSVRVCRRVSSSSYVRNRVSMCWKAACLCDRQCLFIIPHGWMPSVLHWPLLRVVFIEHLHPVWHCLGWCSNQDWHPWEPGAERLVVFIVFELYVSPPRF